VDYSIYKLRYRLALDQGQRGLQGRSLSLGPAGRRPSASQPSWQLVFERSFRPCELLTRLGTSNEKHEATRSGYGPYPNPCHILDTCHMDPRRQQLIQSVDLIRDLEVKLSTVTQLYQSAPQAKQSWSTDTQKTQSYYQDEITQTKAKLKYEKLRLNLLLKCGMWKHLPSIPNAHIATVGGC